MGTEIEVDAKVEFVALAIAKEIGWGSFSHFDPNDMRRVARATVEAIDEWNTRHPNTGRGLVYGD